MNIPRTISLGLLLASLWLLLSGHYNPLLLSLGMCSVVFVLFIARRMKVLDQESHPIQINPWTLIKYWLWLFKEVFLSNIAVCRCILHPGLPIAPSVITLAATQKTDLGRVIYANSITLTPGTVTLAIDEDRLQVHSLMPASSQSLQQGEMARKVNNLAAGI